MVLNKTTHKTLQLLLSGKLAQYSRYSGKHVLVIKDKIIPLKEGKQARKDIHRLEKKYGQKPVLTYVPRKDTSYILIWVHKKK